MGSESEKQLGTENQESENIGDQDHNQILSKDSIDQNKDCNEELSNSLDDYDDNFDEDNDGEYGDGCSDGEVETLTLHGVTYSWPCDNIRKDEKMTMKSENNDLLAVSFGRSDPAVSLELQPVVDVDKMTQYIYQLRKLKTKHQVKMPISMKLGKLVKTWLRKFRKNKM